jgi:hypothetical protein
VIYGELVGTVVSIIIKNFWTPVEAVACHIGEDRDRKKKK